jgi:hypothetical protein
MCLSSVLSSVVRGVAENGSSLVLLFRFGDPLFTVPHNNARTEIIYLDKHHRTLETTQTGQSRSSRTVIHTRLVLFPGPRPKSLASCHVVGIRKPTRTCNTNQQKKNTVCPIRDRPVRSAEAHKTFRSEYVVFEIEG